MTVRGLQMVPQPQIKQVLSPLREVWSTVTPATGSATQFSCVTPASQEVTISTAANAVVYYPMSARLVVEKNHKQCHCG